MTGIRKFTEKEPWLIVETVDHPPHYSTHPSGVECIQVTEHMNFNLGNAVKYIWRCDLKNDEIQDLRKAVWYINREIDRRGRHKQIRTEGEASTAP